ncbi:Transketolase, thiamine diphosphate binding domain [Teratosphaeria destructans]|uniref:transketolase n=1 Tax=Teratosphaeria destructans TaxID=418781 RepID=A0A9W7SUI9_9PEZI|nr:Transketolase, thiamine diphosphate binding domain [Teratosphaeria destructans]
MAPSAVAVSTGDVAHLPLKLDGKMNGAAEHVEDVRMEAADKTQFVLRSYRCLIADLCQQFNMGHPGSAMGMAAIGVALWKYVMKYSPKNADFFNRDRFVLSNGHACLFQYSFLHLTGYKNMTFEQLASYHSDRWDSYCPGHPEIEHEGIEVTTGPLGQGIANAVGLAMATKHLGAAYNRPGFDLVNNMTWVTIGDACLQEGVGMEAIQLAGHWRLDNLCVIYDNNQISCDGSIDIAMCEDVNLKMRASGFHVLEVEDGNYDVESIVKALVQARAHKDKPTFINIKTTIGVGSKNENKAAVHGAPLGKDDVAAIKKNYGMDESKHLEVSQEVYDFFREAVPRGQQMEKDWNALLQNYTKAHPEVAAEFKKRMRGELLDDFTKYIPKPGTLPTEPTPSRKSAGAVCNPLAEHIGNFMVGTADLSPSVNMAWKTKVDFQHPDLRTACGINGDYTGRYIHWGIREHAMASVSNGMAAFQKGCILPVTSSFFMFYIYAAPGVRMGALQSLQVIHIATHDSIGTGEDGPTHQPIELAALYRAMPNFLFIRPCDGEEAAGAFLAAVPRRDTPSMISVARQNVEQFPTYSSRDGVQKGAYVFIEEPDAAVTLLSCGAEMTFAVGARRVLAEKYGIKARVVSFPCQRIFEEQPRAYRQHVLGQAPRVVIEAYSVHGWERYADAGFSMHSFGHSLPREYVYPRFNFDPDKIAAKVQGLVQEVRAQGVEILRGDFRDLNTDYVRDVFHSPHGTITDTR